MQNDRKESADVAVSSVKMLVIHRPAEQGAAAAEPVGDDAVDRSADQESDQSAGDQ